MTDEELHSLVDALALQAVGWSTEAEQKLRNDAWQVVAKRVGFLRKESEIALLEKRLAQLKESNT